MGFKAGASGTCSATHSLCYPRQLSFPLWAQPHLFKSLARSLRKKKKTKQTWVQVEFSIIRCHPTLIPKPHHACQSGSCWTLRTQVTLLRPVPAHSLQRPWPVGSPACPLGRSEETARFCSARRPQKPQLHTHMMWTLGHPWRVFEETEQVPTKPP